MNATFSGLAGAIASFAPTLATMLGGPLAGAAVSSLTAAFGLAPTATAADITKVVQSGGMTPEIIAAVRVADQHHAEVMGQQGIDLAKLNADTDAAFNTAVIADVADARKAGSGNWMVMWIGVLILVSFLVAMILVLAGCWALIAGNITISPEQAGSFAAVTGLVGAIVGYFASNAQVVINYLYGGSLGGRKNAENLAAATQQLGASLGKAANTSSAPTP